MHAGVPALGAVDHPLVTDEFGTGLQPGGIAAVVGFGESEGHRTLAGEHGLDPLGLLRLGAEPVHHDHLGEVADDRGLVLQVVVQTESLVRQVFPDHRHIEVGAVTAAELRRQPITQPARLIGAAAHLVEQVLPVPIRYPALVEVSPGELATPVEVLHVLAFKWLDLRLDEGIHLGQEWRKVLGQGEIHQFSLRWP